MKEIVSVSLGPSDADYEFSAQAFGAEFQVRRIGTDGDTERARALLAEFDGKADAIGLGEMNLRFSVGQRSCTQCQIQSLASAAKITPVVDGSHLKSTLDRWFISQAARQHEDVFRYRRVFFLSGIDQFALAQVLNRYTDRFHFGDPIFHLNLPFALGSLGQLELYARWVLPRLCRKPYVTCFPNR